MEPRPSPGEGPEDSATVSESSGGDREPMATADDAATPLPDEATARSTPAGPSAGRAPAGARGGAGAGGEGDLPARWLAIEHLVALLGPYVCRDAMQQRRLHRPALAIRAILEAIKHNSRDLRLHVEKNVRLQAHLARRRAIAAAKREQARAAAAAAAAAAGPVPGSAGAAAGSSAGGPGGSGGGPGSRLSGWKLSRGYDESSYYDAPRPVPRYFAPDEAADGPTDGEDGAERSEWSEEEEGEAEPGFGPLPGPAGPSGRFAPPAVPPMSGRGGGAWPWEGGALAADAGRAGGSLPPPGAGPRLYSCHHPGCSYTTSNSKSIGGHVRTCPEGPQPGGSVGARGASSALGGPPCTGPRPAPFVFGTPPLAAAPAGPPAPAAAAPAPPPIRVRCSQCSKVLKLPGGTKKFKCGACAAVQVVAGPAADG